MEMIVKSGSGIDRSYHNNKYNYRDNCSNQRSKINAYVVNLLVHNLQKLADKIK